MVHTIERLRAQVASWASDAAKALDSGALGTWSPEPGSGRRKGQVQVRLPTEVADPLRATGHIVAAALPKGYFFQLGRPSEEDCCRKAFKSAPSDQAVHVSTQHSDWHLEGYMNGCGQASEALWRRISVRKKTQSKRADGSDPYAAVIVHKRHPRIALFLVVERSLLGELARICRRRLSEVASRFPQAVTLSQGWVEPGRRHGAGSLDHFASNMQPISVAGNCLPVRDSVATGTPAACAPTSGGRDSNRISTRPRHRDHLSLDAPVVVRTSRKRGKHASAEHGGGGVVRRERAESVGDDRPIERERTAAAPAATPPDSTSDEPGCACVDGEERPWPVSWDGAPAVLCPVHDGPMAHVPLPRDNAGSAQSANSKHARRALFGTTATAHRPDYCAGSMSMVSAPRAPPLLSSASLAMRRLSSMAADGTDDTPEGNAEPGTALIRTIPSPTPSHHAPTTHVHYRASHAPLMGDQLDSQHPSARERAECEPSLSVGLDAGGDEMLSEVESILRRPEDPEMYSLRMLPTVRLGPLQLAHAGDPFDFDLATSPRGDAAF